MNKVLRSFVVVIEVELHVLAETAKEAEALVLSGGGGLLLPEGTLWEITDVTAEE